VDVLAVCCGRRARISEANRWVKFQVFAAASVVHHLTFPGSSFGFGSRHSLAMP